MKSPKNFEKVAILKTIFEFDSDNGISLDHGSSLCVITLVRQPSVDWGDLLHMVWPEEGCITFQG